MANNYIISRVATLGDSLTVVGSVNGVTVIVYTFVSAAGSAMASVIAFRNFIAPLMLALVPTPTENPTLTGSFTQ
jgi:hypothetical protein